MGSPSYLAPLTFQVRRRCPALDRAERQQAAADRKQAIDDLLRRVRRSGHDATTLYGVAGYVIDHGYKSTSRTGRPPRPVAELALMVAAVEMAEQDTRSRAAAVAEAARLLDLTEDVIDKAGRQFVDNIDRRFAALSEGDREALECELLTASRDVLRREIAGCAETEPEFRQGSAA